MNVSNPSIKEKNNPNQNLYVKHQSFDNFVSNLNTDIVYQEQRAIKILTEYLPFEKDGGRLNIGKLILEDLKAEKSLKRDFYITVPIADDISKLLDNELPRYLIHRYRYDVFPQKKILDKFPPYLQIEPSSICNFRCVFCYQTDKEFTSKATGFMGTMSLDMFKQIIDQIVGNVEFISLASRGEPFVCKEIDQMLKYCVGKFLGLKVNTNASLLNEKHCHALLSGGVNTVVFSADEAEEPKYSELRVGGNLEQIL